MSPSFDPVMRNRAQQRLVGILVHKHLVFIRRRRLVGQPEAIALAPLPHHMGNGGQAGPLSPPASVGNGFVVVAVEFEPWNGRAAWAAGAEIDGLWFAVGVGATGHVVCAGHGREGGDQLGHGVVACEHVGEAATVGFARGVDPCRVDAVGGQEGVIHVFGEANVVDRTVGKWVTLPLGLAI